MFGGIFALLTQLFKLFDRTLICTVRAWKMNCPPLPSPDPVLSRTGTKNLTQHRRPLPKGLMQFDKWTNPLGSNWFCHNRFDLRNHIMRTFQNKVHVLKRKIYKITNIYCTSKSWSWSLPIKKFHSEVFKKQSSAKGFQSNPMLTPQTVIIQVLMSQSLCLRFKGFLAQWQLMYSMYSVMHLNATEHGAFWQIFHDAC